MKPPFNYFGGKTGMADRIAALLPPHKHYIEPFGGSLAVLLAKPPSRLETVNDLNGDLMTFWRVLRDRGADLEQVCALTPHSRGEHTAAYERSDDELEQARRVWVRLTQGRNGHLWRPTGWQYRADGNHGPVSTDLRGYVSRMPAAARRLASVTLECAPAAEIISMYGRDPENLIYADPPYVGAVRNGRGYGHEMLTEDEHRELLEALLDCRAAVVLSGYASSLYDGLLGSWSRREIATQTGNGSGDRSRIEVLWSNRPFPQGSLFDAMEAS